MKRTPLSIPEIGIIAGTRAAIGAGIALLLADRFKNSDQRRAVGWTLVAVGAITTIPIAIQLIRSLNSDDPNCGAVTGGRLAHEEYSS